jgi:hypothetical protein
MTVGAANDIMSNLSPKDSVPANDPWYRSAHGLVQWMENSARVDVSFPVRVLGAAVDCNTPAHDEAMMRLVAWVHAHDADGICIVEIKPWWIRALQLGQMLPSPMVSRHSVHRAQ